MQWNFLCFIPIIVSTDFNLFNRFNRLSIPICYRFDARFDTKVNFSYARLKRVRKRSKLMPSLLFACVFRYSASRWLDSYALKWRTFRIRKVGGYHQQVVKLSAGGGCVRDGVGNLFEEQVKWHTPYGNKSINDTYNCLQHHITNKMTSSGKSRTVSCDFKLVI